MVKDTLAGISKKDVQTGVAIGFLALFGIIVVAIFMQSSFDITIQGNIDPNMVWATFIGIVMSIALWLGFRSGVQAK